MTATLQSRHLKRTLFNCPAERTRQMTLGESACLKAILERTTDAPIIWGHDAPLRIRDLYAPYSVDNNAKRIAERLAMTRHLQFDLDVIALCAACSDRPAVAVMWAYGLTLHARATQCTMTPLDWSEFFGRDRVPTEEYMRECWLEQKGHNGHPDNWLDSKEAWK